MRSRQPRAPRPRRAEAARRRAEDSPPAAPRAQGDPTTIQWGGRQPARKADTMDLRKLKTLIDLVAESGISELEITEGEGKVRIVKAPPVQPAAMPMQMAAPVAMAG